MCCTHHQSHSPEIFKHDVRYVVMRIANNALQQTKTALASFNIRLSHTGLLPRQGLLPVVRARFWLLKASVSHLPYCNRQFGGLPFPWNHAAEIKSEGRWPLLPFHLKYSGRTSRRLAWRFTKISRSQHDNLDKNSRGCDTTDSLWPLIVKEERGRGGRHRSVSCHMRL